MSFLFRAERPDDAEGIDRLHQAAFASDAEANLVAALRSGGFVDASFVATTGLNSDKPTVGAPREQIIGHVLFSRVMIHTKDGEIASATSLAPMAVLPEYQRQGVGTQLMTFALERLRQSPEGPKIVVVLGHPQFYRRFGFSAELARTLQSPFGAGDAWMAMELKPGALAGITGEIQYPPPFLDMA